MRGFSGTSAERICRLWTENLLRVHQFKMAINWAICAKDLGAMEGHCTIRALPRKWPHANTWEPSLRWVPAVITKQDVLVQFNFLSSTVVLFEVFVYNFQRNDWTTDAIMFSRWWKLWEHFFSGLSRAMQWHPSMHQCWQSSVCHDWIWRIEPRRTNAIRTDKT